MNLCPAARRRRPRRARAARARAAAAPRCRATRLGGGDASPEHLVWAATTARRDRRRGDGGRAAGLRHAGVARRRRHQRHRAAAAARSCAARASASRSPSTPRTSTLRPRHRTTGFRNRRSKHGTQEEAMKRRQTSQVQPSPPPPRRRCRRRSFAQTAPKKITFLTWNLVAPRGLHPRLDPALQVDPPRRRGRVARQEGPRAAGLLPDPARGRHAARRHRHPGRARPRIRGAGRAARPDAAVRRRGRDQEPLRRRLPLELGVRGQELHGARTTSPRRCCSGTRRASRRRAPTSRRRASTRSSPSRTGSRAARRPAC